MPADGTTHPEAPAPECPFCGDDVTDDGGFCLRCKERVIVAPPVRLQGNARLFLRSLGYEPQWMCGPRTAKGFLHDVAFNCTACGDWFRSSADMAEEDDQPEFERLCHYCRWGLWKPGEAAGLVGRAG